MQWEYLTTFLQADARLEEAFLAEFSDWKDGVPAYTPEALIPRLNAYGEQGWELIHMQPVAVGSKADVLLMDNSGSRFWTSKYFCVFKRAKTGS
ncbi:MAG: hypothetical protein IT319_01445 [Anaerolineae bacterium]|nr:hypothetical protein [Anaerolineae bacterium]